MRTVLCIPSGRRRYMKCLIPYVLRERKVFDECRLWVNNWESEDDREYIYSLPDLDPGFFRIEDDGQSKVTGAFSHYGRYYKDCYDPDTLYVKCDDDIVWVHPGSFGELVAARKRYRDPIIVCGNIVNNTLCNTLHNRLLDYDYHGWHNLSPDPHCQIGNKNPDFAVTAHEILLGAIPKEHVHLYYDFGGYWVNHNTHVPNHVFAWFGSDTAWSTNDEKFITTELTKTTARPTYFHGPAIFVHYAYSDQHSGMPPQLLERFANLAGEVSGV